MNCRQVLEYLDSLVTADAPVAPGIEEHIGSCESCRRDYAAALKTLALLQPSKTQIEPQPLKERVMKKVLESGNPPMGTEVTQARPKMMRFMKPALAAGIAAVALLAVWSMLPGAHNYAYALEQTVQVNEALRSIHVKVTNAAQNITNEFWACFDTSGNVQSLRMKFPETDDGPKETVCEGDKAHVYMSRKNLAITVVEKKMLDRAKREFQEISPKSRMAQLCQEQKEGSSDIEIQEGAQEITVTKNDADGREVFYVDPNTKYLRKHETYKVEGGVPVLKETCEFLDYDRVNNDIFALNIPGGTEIVDQTAQEVGLVKGDLTDNEIAVKVVREFFEALIAKDYAKAGSLYEGTSEEKMEEAFGKMKFVRIISFGDCTPEAVSSSIRVPCKVEIEEDGKLQEWSPYGPFVRPVYGQPDRWTISGGV